MCCLNCDRVFKRQSLKGFRLKLRRFSVQRLRSKLFYLLRLFSRLKSCYAKAVGSLRRNRPSQNERNSSEAPLYVYASSSKIRPLAHSNSFCAAAIADCVDFIKRNSVSGDDETRSMLNR